ncbi:MAG TPA: C2 family cysteine protease, partial [Myxococcota bacterium]|nr:C2 family cysteine protease [Myxococcota bacterium]
TTFAGTARSRAIVTCDPADRVVRGDSAVDLLSQVAEPGPVGAGGSSVQLDLMSTEELATYGAAGFALFGKTSFGHVVHRLERYHAAKTPEDKRTHALKLIEHIQAWEKSDSRNTLDPTKKAADEKKAEGLKKLKLQATTEAEFIRMKSDQVQPEANPRLHTIQVGDQSVMPRMVASTAPLFGDNEPSMDGIKQGALGDCWLLAGLGALVNKDPGYIKGMMTDNGTSVTVRLFDDKGPKFIKVNKEVPKVAVPDPSSSSGGTRDVDTFAKGNLWVQMIEKAVAVHMQSYKSTEGSKGNIAFSVLTGSGGTKLTNTADMRRKPWPGGGNSDGGKTEDVMCKKVAVQALGDTDAATWWAFATKYRPQLTSAQTLEAVQKVATDHAEEIDASIVQTLGAFLKTQNLLPGRMGSGNYSRSQMDAWSFITKGLSSGALMSAGTNASIGDSEGSGGSGEAKVKGMAGGHQYTLLATKTDERGRNWIQVRNPWGRYSREYDEAEDGTLTAKAKGGEGDNGQSWIELSDFCAMFGNDVYK